MTTRRDQIQQASIHAAEMYDKYRQPTRPSMDVLGILGAMDIPVMFQPLSPLLGGTVTTDDGGQGIIVTTKLPRSVQRFTLAHELGHVMLGHKNHFDETVCFQHETRSLQRRNEEIAADTFAADLLAPREALFSLLAERCAGREDAILPASIYQMALRLGISFQACLHSYRNANILTWDDVNALGARRGLLRSVKREVGGPTLEDAWGDAWHLGAPDEGIALEAGPTDVYRFEADELAGSGYVWELQEPQDLVKVVLDGTEPRPGYGAASRRSITFTIAERGRWDVTFRQRRPWNNESLGQWTATLDNFGKEDGGLPRRTRAILLSQGGAP